MSKKWVMLVGLSLSFVGLLALLGCRSPDYDPLENLDDIPLSPGSSVSFFRIGRNREAYQVQLEGTTLSYRRGSSERAAWFTLELSEFQGSPRRIFNGIYVRADGSAVKLYYSPKEYEWSAE